MMTASEERVERLVINVLHYMRHIVIASVGYRRTEISYLERREVHLTLTDCYGDDGQSVPRTVIGVVIEIGIGNQSALLAGQIDTELITEPHTDHIVTPAVHGILNAWIFLTITYHII